MVGDERDRGSRGGAPASLGLRRLERAKTLAPGQEDVVMTVARPATCTINWRDSRATVRHLRLSRGVGRARVLGRTFAPGYDAEMILASSFTSLA